MLCFHSKTCKSLLNRFKSGDFDVGDKERLGQPKKYEDGALLKETKLQKQLNAPPAGISKRLHARKMIQKEGTN